MEKYKTISFVSDYIYKTSERKEGRQPNNDCLKWIMKTYHVGGLNPVRRYKTLDAALAQAKDDDTIELHKNITFSGTITKNIILNGNQCTINVENGTIGIDCTSPVVLNDVNFISEPRANAIVLRNGGRLTNITTKIKGPARVLYPTLLVKGGKVTAANCTFMRVSAENETSFVAEDSTFCDYYGGVFHLAGKENLSVFSGNAVFSHCHFDCCYFKGTATIKDSVIGVYNRSNGDVKLYRSSMEPKQNTPSVNLKKEPVDGPMEHCNEGSHFAWEQESGSVLVNAYTSNIPEPFVGFHVLSGSLELQNVNNPDVDGYHVVLQASLSFTDCIDAAFYEAKGASVSMVRSKVETSIKTKTAMERLQELTGLETVKKKLKSIVNNIAMNKRTKNKDFGFSYHMVFAGDPGTGKTTVAKIVAQALFEIGAIPENKCTEVAADSLVKGFVGQTAEHMRSVLDGALGGVLFIDEAYELTVKDNQNSFNSDVLSVLIRYMEEHRDNLVVIAAGYEKEMKEFLASNVGLTRRFQWVSFTDYTPDEMSVIFESMRKSYGEDYADERLPKLLPAFFEKLTDLYLRKPDARGRVTNGGNGGLVRNVFQQVLTARNNRVADQPDTTMRITNEDLTNGFREEMQKAVQI